VILADGHPATSLDAGWRTLFGDVRRIARFERRPHRLDTLVLTTLGWDSPMLDFDAWALPLAEDFRRFVLEAHGLATDALRPSGPCASRWWCARTTAPPRGAPPARWSGSSPTRRSW
jgi:hypothetical protein